MNERNKIIISIVVVIIIIIAAVGGTFAYWQWTSTTAQKTNITLSVPDASSQLSATLTGSSVSVYNLAPAACTNNSYAMKQPFTISYSNNSSRDAAINGTLTVSAWTVTGVLTASDLSHLHYAVTPSTSADCNTNVITNMSGTFPGTNAAIISNETFTTVEANTTDSDSYYLWVWLDSDYENIDNKMNTGNDVNDPMQTLSFTLTWTGEIVNE